MGFSFWRLFRQRDKEAETVTAEEFFDLYADAYIRDLAFESCVNLVANAISKCELLTFERDKVRKGPDHYRWNTSPNLNQNSTAFWHKLIHHLYRDGCALVIEEKENFLVADSFDRREYALYDDLFSGVTIGDFTFDKTTFHSSEVLFFELSSVPVKRLLDGLYNSYAKLIAYGMKGYQRSRGEKGTLELDTAMAGNQDFKDKLTAIQNDGFRKFVEAENAVLPLARGMKYNRFESRTYTADTTRDIRAMIDDITDFTARAYGIPPALLNGTVEDVDSAVEQFLTICVDPLADNLAEEINRKQYGERLVNRGTYVQFDTGQLRHVDIMENASQISTLVGSGAFCVNDLRAILGQPLILEAWANEYFITRNFSTVEELIEKLKTEGGEEV